MKMKWVGSDVPIDFGDGDVLTIDNIKLNQLSKSDFVELEVGIGNRAASMRSAARPAAAMAIGALALT